MSDQPEPQQENVLLPPPPPRTFRNSQAITVTLIISCAVIVLACIASVTIVTAYFFANLPW
jgi:hypothetical protein